MAKPKNVSSPYLRGNRGDEEFGPNEIKVLDDGNSSSPSDMEKIPKNVSMLIIGGGLIGSATARNAARDPANNKGVVLIEKCEFGGGSSRGGSRIIRVTTQQDEKDFARLSSNAARRSIDTWKTASDEELISPKGCVYLAFEPNTLDKTAIGLEQVASASKRHLPYFRDSKLRYMKYEGADLGTSGTMNPHAVIMWNLKQANESGKFTGHENTKITSIKNLPGGLTKKPQVKVTLEDGTSYITGRLVIAAGAWVVTGAIREYIKQSAAGRRVLKNVKIKAGLLHFIKIPEKKKAAFENFPAVIMQPEGLTDAEGAPINTCYMMKEVDRITGDHYIKFAFYTPKEPLFDFRTIDQLRMYKTGIPYARTPVGNTRIKLSEQKTLAFLTQAFPEMMQILRPDDNTEVEIGRSVPCPLTYCEDGIHLFGQLGDLDNVHIYVDSGGISAKQSESIGRCLALGKEEMHRFIGKNVLEHMLPGRTIDETRIHERGADKASPDAKTSDIFKWGAMGAFGLSTFSLAVYVLHCNRTSHQEDVARRCPGVRFQKQQCTPDMSKHPFSSRRSFSVVSQYNPTNGYHQLQTWNYRYSPTIPPININLKKLMATGLCIVKKLR